MKEVIKRIDIIFENCEVLYIPIERIGLLTIEDIHTTIGRTAINSFDKFETANTIFIEIFNRTKDLSLNRIVKHNDITSIDVVFHNIPENTERIESYFVDYREPKGQENVIGASNLNQKNFIRESGDVCICISETKKISDFINSEDDRNFEYGLWEIIEEPLDGQIFDKNLADLKTYTEKLLNDSLRDEEDKLKAKKEAIKEIEKLYGDLDFELDCCQGCMGDGPDVYLELLNVYEEILKFLDSEYKLDESRLFSEARKRIEDNK